MTLTDIIAEIEKRRSYPHQCRFDIYEHEWAAIKAALPAWRPIETAPRCVASERRPIIVCRWPITGSKYPVAIARLTSKGWISGMRNNRLWFKPTHWMPLPPAPSAGESLISDNASNSDNKQPSSSANTAAVSRTAIVGGV